MIYLKDLSYKDNKVELIINIKDKQFDGEMRKAIIDIKFKFGIQCSDKSPNLTREVNQEINQEIIWTEYDIKYLSEGINEICNCDTEKNERYSFISLVEQEFEALCVFYSEDLICIYISVGVANIGPTIKLTTTKDILNKWVEKIKKEFHNNT